MSPAPAEQRFRFAGWELPGRLGPAPGRYVLRRFAGDDPQHVLVLREQVRAGWRRGAPAVPVTRAAVIEAAPVDLAAARAWFDDAVGAGAPGSSPPVSPSSTARSPPTGSPPPTRTCASSGRPPRSWRASATGPAPRSAPRAGSGRRDVPVAAARARRPERLELLLSGRDVALACEELALRARLDLDAGRDREAALQLRAALDAAVAELEGFRELGAVAARLGELRAGRERVEAVAAEALLGGLDDAARSAVATVLGRLEAALRVRPAASSAADALDEEAHAHMRAPLAEVVTAQPGRHDVDGLDVAKRTTRLGERLLDGVVGALGRAPDELDDLGDGHRASLSLRRITARPAHELGRERATAGGGPVGPRWAALR